MPGIGWIPHRPDKDLHGKQGKVGCKKGRKIEGLKIEGSEEAVGSHRALKARDKQLLDNAAGSLNLCF